MGGDVRQLTERQPFTSEGDRRLSPQDAATRPDIQRGVHRRGDSLGLPSELLSLLASPLLFIEVRQPLSESRRRATWRAVPHP